jgi:hypothetical protein
MSYDAPLYTVLLVTILPAVFIAIDIVLAMNKRKGDTYSEVLRAAGKKWVPLVIFMSFGMGLLCGHWWW